MTEQHQLLRDESPLFQKTFAPVEIEACAFRNSSNLLGALYQLVSAVDVEIDYS
ncbi:hypothetical protein ACWN8V_10700 [Vagococcus elongatus]|uniref:hypothetical protein n=1 Tax=Vagococcus elongatus TaxID=180344 RepID=UPI001B88136E|nr:hypothetical protein [Vagococcus elongatus]